MMSVFALVASAVMADSLPPVPTQASRTTPPALEGSAGLRLEPQRIRIQLGVRRAGFQGGQFVVGVGLRADTETDYIDSGKVFQKWKEITPRLGGELWFDAPGSLQLTTGAYLEGVMKSREERVERTVKPLGAVENPLHGSQSMDATTDWSGFGPRFSVGIRLPSRSGAFALAGGVESGWSWIRAEMPKVQSGQWEFVEPAWNLGVDFLF